MYALLHCNKAFSLKGLDQGLHGPERVLKGCALRAELIAVDCHQSADAHAVMNPGLCICCSLLLSLAKAFAMLAMLCCQ